MIKSKEKPLWFQHLVDDLPCQDRYSFIKRLTDYHRVHLFDVIMQYRAIFSSKESSSSNTTTHLKSTRNQDNNNGRKLQRVTALHQQVGF